LNFRHGRKADLKLSRRPRFTLSGFVKCAASRDPIGQQSPAAERASAEFKAADCQAARSGIPMHVETENKRVNVAAKTVR
jgi:hypothetical protein